MVGGFYPVVYSIDAADGGRSHQSPDTLLQYIILFRSKKTTAALFYSVPFSNHDFENARTKMMIPSRG